MNNFTKKGFVRKIIIVLIFLTIFNFLHPNITIVQAADSIEKQNESVPGGILLSPVISLITGLCDGVISLIHEFVLRTASYICAYR